MGSFKIIFLWFKSLLGWSGLLAVVILFGLPYIQATDFPTYHQYEQQLRANIINLLASVDPE